MSKREEFIAAIHIIKAASQTITPELHKGLLQQVVQEHELTINEATDIINTSGLVVGEKVNFFQVLGLTNAEFLTFINANPQWGKPPDWFGIKRNRKTAIDKRYHDGDYLKHWDEKSYPQDKAEHPVTWVSWYAARAYAEWVGKRLPTEAEWEKAARAGQNANEYPCGNAINNAKANYNCNVGDTTPVGQYQANSYGLYDMAGNVWEWCFDAYNPHFYTNPIHRNPISDVNSLGIVNSQVATNTIQRVLRGGSWLDATQLLRTTYRYKNIPIRTLAGIGFRCVKNIDVQHNHSL